MKRSKTAVQDLYLQFIMDRRGQRLGERLAWHADKLVVDVSCTVRYEGKAKYRLTKSIWKSPCHR